MSGYTQRDPKPAYCQNGSWVNFPICKPNQPAATYTSDCKPAGNIANRYVKVNSDGSVLCKPGHRTIDYGTPFCNHAAGSLWWNIDKCVPTISWVRESVYAIDTARPGLASHDDARSDCAQVNGRLPATINDVLIAPHVFEWGLNWGAFGENRIFTRAGGRPHAGSTEANLEKARLKYFCIVDCSVDQSQLTLPGYVSIDNKTLNVVCQTGYHVHILKNDLACGTDGFWKNLPSCVRNNV
ncbi:uncharacterized protein LOC135810922 [Sycon ciliatum]|uniref:uncharacterized protein LOC135810922 n=1 Tax=Sycon ciliatum TaxID=27933 RepID=UPI0031F68D87